MTVCTVCISEHRHRIEVGLTHQAPLRVLARRFGCSLYAIHRHGKHHVSPQMKAAILSAQSGCHRMTSHAPGRAKVSSLARVLQLTRRDPNG